MSWWTAIVRAEHAVERFLGLHPPPDPRDGALAFATDGPSPAASATPPTSNAPTSVTPPSASPASLTPKPGNSAAAERIRELGANLARFWPQVTGRSDAMPPQAIELAVAQAGLESSYGAGWKDKTSEGQGDMRGSHNYGARQCGGHDSGGAAWRCVPYGDTEPQADGSSKPIPASFRFYIDAEGRSAAENGAYYFLRDLAKTWPVVDELVAGDVGRYAHRLGPDKANGGLYYYAGFGRTFADRERNYARAIALRLPEVAAALGHPQVYARADASLVPDPRLAGAGAPDPHAMLNAWRDGTADGLRWVPLDLGGGYQGATTGEPLSIGGQPRVLPFGDLLAIAVDAGALPLTPPISDARWRQATDRRIVPPVPSSVGALYNDPAQIAAFYASRGPIASTGLRAGDHKEMVIIEGDPRPPENPAKMQPQGPNSMVFYDWRRADGSTWQKGIRSDHDRNWIEYDSYGNLVARYATKDGRVVDLLDVIAAGGPLGGPLAPWQVAELRGTNAGAPTMPRSRASASSAVAALGAGLASLMKGGA